MKNAKRAAINARRAHTAKRRPGDQTLTHLTEISQLRSNINDLIKQLNALKANKQPKKAYVAEAQGSDTSA